MRISDCSSDVCSSDLEVLGREAGRFLRYICTWDMTRLAPGEGHYAAACREDGGILDDVYVLALTPERYLIVVNASNSPKMKARSEERRVGKECGSKCKSRWSPDN